MSGVDWSNFYSELDMLVVEGGDKCCQCRRHIERGELVRYRFVSGARSGGTQCAACCARECLPLWDEYILRCEDEARAENAARDRLTIGPHDTLDGPCCCGATHRAI